MNSKFRDFALPIAFLVLATFVIAATNADLKLSSLFCIGGKWPVGDQQPWHLLYLLDRGPSIALGVCGLGAALIGGIYRRATELDQAGTFSCYPSGSWPGIDRKFRFQGVLGTTTSTGNRSVWRQKRVSAPLAEGDCSPWAVVSVRTFVRSILSGSSLLRIPAPETPGSCVVDDRRPALRHPDEYCQSHPGRTFPERQSLGVGDGSSDSCYAVLPAAA